MALLGAPAAFAQDRGVPSARQIMEEAERRLTADSLHYEGTLEVVGGGNRVATKRWMFDRIGSFGKSKGMLRFIDPPEVKGVALLIVNHPDRASDQWIWRPAIGREQRVALQDRSTRFFGTDFSFEDLEERVVDQFEFRLASADASHWKVESLPKKSSQYTSTLLWVTKDRYAITKSEAYNKKGLVRTIEYRDFELIKNIWTARTIQVLDLTRNSRTILRYDQIDYNLPMKESAFTVDALRRK
jgi:hypothetical protein